MFCGYVFVCVVGWHLHKKPDVTLGIGRDGSNNNDYILEQDDQLEENESLSFVEFDAERAPGMWGGGLVRMYGYQLLNL
ncbi:hypothetical protein PF005_g28119 [Phytophthora fragariae]|uniref:Uncharacterized protein n=1 Tax=Phytophthora fragariae TaxID=53985 RepID=A0A6A3H928_9STRA|nr:hypothetical protein PF009_g28754 [Phytophthora fragariae]KAE8965298.1 hypothetical protein PF011_g28348 [Phytophthora fragariae]KAE9068407.1 hypothetical protein PF007_g27700 [Phytophthora fragariae]KAE9169063.1 hypothetical protein PF005_g28119 [Phytophthora fragariae]KAE9177490.1 hypothetical protein PF002_g28326 [Phytophthora fragariae]